MGFPYAEPVSYAGFKCFENMLLFTPDFIMNRD